MVEPGYIRIYIYILYIYALYKTFISLQVIFRFLPNLQRFEKKLYIYIYIYKIWYTYIYNISYTIYSERKNRNINRAIDRQMIDRYVDTLFPLISAASWGIHIEVSASPLISVALLYTALIRTVTIFF